MRHINRIFMHCTAGPQTQTPEDIQAYWKTVLGWSVPGYHFEIDAAGKIHQLLDISKVANGVKGYNANSIHISYIGGVEVLPGLDKRGAAVNRIGKPIDNRTDAQKASQISLLEEHSAMFPAAIILGHRDISPDKNRDGILQPDEWVKACPSYSVSQWLNEVNFKSKLPRVLMTTTGVNIRSGAGVQFPKVAPTLTAGIVARFLGEADGWSYICVEGSGIKGWVKSEYLKN